MLIRPATLEDVDAIAALCQRSVRAIRRDQPPALLAHWARQLDAGRIATILGEQTAWVATDGALTGFASLAGDVLWMLYVAPEREGQGIGRALVRTVATQAISNGVDILRVDASLNGLQAYLAFGFIDDGREEKTDGSGTTYHVHKMHAPATSLLA